MRLPVGSDRNSAGGLPVLSRRRPLRPDDIRHDASSRSCVKKQRSTGVQNTALSATTSTEKRPHTKAKAASSPIGARNRRRSGQRIDADRNWRAASLSPAPDHVDVRGKGAEKQSPERHDENGHGFTKSSSTEKTTVAVWGRELDIATLPRGTALYCTATLLHCTVCKPVGGRHTCWIGAHRMKDLWDPVPSGPTPTSW